MDNIEKPELSLEEKAAIIDACKMFGIGANNGEDLSIKNPSEEPDSLEIFDVSETEDEAHKSIFDNEKINLTKKSNDIDLGSIMNFQEMRDNAEIRRNLIKDELKFSKTVEDIDLDKLVEVHESVNFFAVPNNEEFLDLTSSLDQFGVINPLIVMKSKDSDKYIVLVGRSRLYALRSLYAESEDMRFFKVPCILLDSSTDPNLIQGLIISTNMKYRKLSLQDKIQSILILENILAKSKNYRELKYLCPKGMELVKQKYMNLGIARLLSQKDHKTQEIIINGLGSDLNNVKMVNRMLEGPSQGETWEEKTKRTREIVPAFTTITIKVAFQEVEGTFIGLAAMRREYALKYAATKKNSINSIFKVSVNEKDMAQYIKRGFLKQETLNKVLSTEFNDIIKLA